MAVALFKRDAADMIERLRMEIAGAHGVALKETP
jgi:hypothetical protein